MSPSETDIKKAAAVSNSDANRDPITGAPGAHPVGVGAGAAGGGATGALIGAVVAGPIGASVGAVVGAVAGGLAGKGAAEAVNPTVEHAYWRGAYQGREYVPQGSTYELYGPAYQYGWESYSSHGEYGQTFEAAEPELRAGWEARAENKKLSWSDARGAMRDAWLRVEQSECGRRAV